LLNDDNSLANKQWADLTKEIDKLDIGQEFNYGEYTIIFEEIPDDEVRKMTNRDLDALLYGNEGAE
jgi:hypothetical protein